MWILYSLFLFVSISGQDDVRLPPSITINPEEEIIFRELRDIKLTCSAKGTPPITFEWWHNGRSRCTTGSASPSLGVFAGDLTIKNATGKDDGFFQCFAKNGYGTALSRVAHVQHAFLQGGMPSNANITVQEGHPFVIPAARRNSFPTPTYSWETARVADDRSPEKILTTQRVNRAWNGDLHFAYALKDDDLNGGIYKSIIFNVHVEQTLGAGYTRVNVTQGSGLPPDFPPNITYFAKKQDVALIGRNVDLKCFFSGKPLPNITWSRPGNYLPLRRHTIPSSEYETLLSISNVMESDEGDYVCTANNSEGTVSHTFNIRVEAEPVFKQVYDGPYNVNLTEGDSITFNCSAFAEPKPNIVWLWNGKPIDATNVGLFTRFSLSNDNSSLTIRDVCRECVDRESKTDLMVIQCNASNVHGYAFSQGYLNVLRSYSSTFLEGNDATESWSQPNTDDSFDKKFRDLLEMVNNLKGDALNQAVVAKIVRQLSALTNNSEVLSPENRNASVMILKQLTVLIRVSNIRLNATEIEAIIQAISNVLEDVDKITVTDIWLIMDDFGLILANMRIPGPGHIAVYKDNLVLAAWAFEMSNSSLQIEFPNGSLWGENRGDRISISMETLNGSILTENSTNWKMWGVYYRNIHENLPGKNDTDDVVNSRVISFSIVGLKTNETLKPPVLITLQHNEEKARSYRRTCGFLNSNRSGWDSFGCSVTSTNKTHTICSCDHLTNFAILMSRNPVYDTKLSLISIIGCNISVAALLLTVIIYAVTWKHAKSSQAALLLNLCIALIVAYIIFMAGADKVEFSGYSMVGCHVVAVLMHYFFLVAFFIMLAEGVDMVLYIFFVFHVRRTRETIMLIAAAWVLPMIIVGVSLGVTRLEGYGHDEACWLSSEKGLIWAFIGPVLCIIAINLVILIIILRLISKKKAILAKNSRKREEIRATIWNLSVMCPVLGLGWLFGVFSVFFDHVAFQYVFVIANSMHGLLIFIIYALFHNKKMNETISAVYSQYRKTDSSGSNHMNNSSQEHSTNSTANIRTTRPSLQPKSSDSDEFGTKAEVSTHNSGLKDSLLENKAEIHQETAFDHR